MSRSTLENVYLVCIFIFEKEATLTRQAANYQKLPSWTGKRCQLHSPLQSVPVEYYARRS